MDNEVRDIFEDMFFIIANWGISNGYDVSDLLDDSAQPSEGSGDV